MSERPVMHEFHFWDGASVAAILAAFVGWLPPIATGLACIWYGILIYDRLKGSRASHIPDDHTPHGG